MRAFVELLERWRPGLAATLEPASDAAIDELEALAGALPGAYMAFLRTMGASTGAFELGDANFGVDDVMAVHAGLAGPDSGWASPFLLVGFDAGGRHFFLDRGAPHGEGDCMVVRMGLGRAAREHRTRLHAGFVEMLYVAAYEGLRMPRLTHHRRFARPRDGAGGCQAVVVCARLEALGFQRVPPATRSAIYERGDAAVLLHHSPASPAFSLVVAADDADALARVCDALAVTGVVREE